MEQHTAEVIQLPEAVRGLGPWAHHEYDLLVRETTSYIVFIDKNGRVDWETSDDYDASQAVRTAAEKRDRNVMLGQVAVAEASPCDAFSEETRRQFKRMLGEAIVCIIEHDGSSAAKMVIAANAFHRKRSEEMSRSWYLSAASLSASVVIVAGLVAWLLRVPLTGALGGGAMALIVYASGGALGALLSVIARSGKLHFDSCATKALHELEASSRILAGAISAVLIVLAIKAGLLFGALADLRTSSYFLLFAAVASGAAERFATSLVSKFEGSGVDSYSKNTHKEKDEE